MKLPFRKNKELYLSLRKILGFYPHDISYYQLALMHKSVMHRNKKGKPVNNERLEFLGDAILDAIVGDIVYRHFPGKREGFLTNTRSKLVQRETLNKLAREMGIDRLILSNGRGQSHNSYLGGNAFEALVGALYLDRGYDMCMRFMEKRILSQMINIDKVAYKEVNFKSKLIEWSQKNRVKLTFELREQAKDNNGSPKFCYQVVLEGEKVCLGSGYSKKESQQLASKLTLEKLKKEPQFIDAVFEAKASRTKMEEEPVENVPDTSESSEFIISSDKTIPEEEKHVTAFQEKVYTDRPAKPLRRSPMYRAQEAAQSQKEQSADDFDLSDISAAPQSKEYIIAAAEAEAFGKEDS